MKDNFLMINDVSPKNPNLQNMYLKAGSIINNVLSVPGGIMTGRMLFNVKLASDEFNGEKVEKNKPLEFEIYSNLNLVVKAISNDNIHFEVDGKDWCGSHLPKPDKYEFYLKYGESNILGYKFRPAGRFRDLKHLELLIRIKVYFEHDNWAWFGKTFTTDGKLEYVTTDRFGDRYQCILKPDVTTRYAGLLENSFGLTDEPDKPDIPEEPEKPAESEPVTIWGLITDWLNAKKWLLIGIGAGALVIFILGIMIGSPKC